MTTATSAPVTDTDKTLDKTLDASLATVAGEIIGVCAGSHRLLVSITTACQQAGAGLPVRR
ncbi:hypothetical protein [Streptomyces mirabilis]|uniref:hypothetical protein n=1 Tax=Streptomyces mirabilis TaxID=68239 RepID=UPI003669A684